MGDVVQAHSWERTGRLLNDWLTETGNQSIYPLAGCSIPDRLSTHSLLPDLEPIVHDLERRCHPPS